MSSNIYYSYKFIVAGLQIVFSLHCLNTYCHHPNHMKQNFRIQYYLRIANVSLLPLFHSWFVCSAASTHPTGVHPEGVFLTHPELSVQ